MKDRTMVTLIKQNSLIIKELRSLNDQVRKLQYALFRCKAQRNNILEQWHNVTQPIENIHVVIDDYDSDINDIIDGGVY